MVAKFSLYALILGSVVFLAATVLIISIVPTQVYQGTQYQQSTLGDIQGSSFLLFGNNSAVFTLNYSSSHSETVGTIPITFGYGSFFFAAGSGSPETQAAFYIEDTSSVLWIIPHVQFLGITGDSSKYGNLGAGAINYIPPSYLLSNFYDAASDTVHLKMNDQRVTISFVMTGHGMTLYNALTSNGPIDIQYSYQLNYADMGGNVLTIILSVLTGQSIHTGESYSDLILNAFVTLPVDISLAYIIYKLIAGLIPTVSGGSGT
jgi:hypothetical protein